MDVLVLCGLAMLAGAPLALSPWVAATAVLIVAFVVTRAGPAPRVRSAWVVVALISSGACSWRARSTLEDAARAWASTLASLEHPARCEGSGVVIASPIVQRKSRGERGREARIDVMLDDARCGAGPPAESRLNATVRLHGADEALARGDRVRVVADLAAVHAFDDEGRTDPRVGFARSGVTASGGIVDMTLVGRAWSLAGAIDRARAHVRRRIEATFHRDAAPLARALVLGETDLADADAEAFRASGLAHLLAVSGTHLVIAVLGACAALRAALLHVGPLAARLDVARVAAGAGIPAAWLYASFAGSGGSAFRAAAMLTAALLARALGRRPNAVRAFGWSLVAGASFDPLAACDASFMLSAAATAGLLALEPPASRLLGRGPGPVRKIGRALAATLAAVAGCAPVLATISPSLPVLGVIANLVAAPIGEAAALPVCLAHAVLAWAPDAERGAAVVGSGALLVVRAIARWTAANPAAVVSVPAPTDVQLAVFAIAAACLHGLAPRARKIAVVVAMAALLVAEAAAARAGRAEGSLRVSVLDVGQGDAALVDLPDGSAILVDGGGLVGSPVDVGERVIAPLLRARRRTKLDAVVLSHPHPDHFGGLPAVLERARAAELWDSGQGEAEGAGATYAGLLDRVRRSGGRVVRPDELCGRPRAFGAATVTLLAPCPSFHADRGANDNSLVLRVALGRRAALLVGDAEHEQEAELVARYGSALRADFLKVGHHGSRTSSTAQFLDAVRPSAVAISCGVRNRFGHPHAEALSNLVRDGRLVARTDRDGMIVWQTDGERAVLRRRGSMRSRP